MTTKETTKRTPSPETLRKRTMNAYIDAQAATAKAKTAMVAALERYSEAADNECEARNDCLTASLPVTLEPTHYGLVALGGADRAEAGKP